MLSWLWKRWSRKTQHPPNSLAYFQVYGSETAPPTDYPGPVWRYHVSEDVKLECHLMPILDEPSFLTRRQKPPMQVFPPLFKVVGQLKADQPDIFPIGEWLAQGTLWWLRQLSTTQVTGLLAYLLLIGHGHLDRARYPQMDLALTQLLANRTLPAPPDKTEAKEKPEDSTPPRQKPSPTPPRPWNKAPLQVQAGPATIQFLDRRDGKCYWQVAGNHYWQPLWEDPLLSLIIEVKSWDGSPELLREEVKTAFLGQVNALTRQLERFPGARRRLLPLLRRLKSPNPH